jgi:hypothetical protein
VDQQPQPLHWAQGYQSQVALLQNCHLPPPQHCQFVPFFHSHLLLDLSWQSLQVQEFVQTCWEQPSQLPGWV